MSGFANPIVGGGGDLIYPSIHSPNYVAGVSGWTINKDGSVEFNTGSFRSTVIVGASSGPQVKILPGVNIPVTTSMTNTGSPASDITSITNLQQVIELPSNDGTEVFPPLIGELTVNWADGSKSDGTLTTAGFNSLLGTSSFTLNLSQSSNAAHAQCTITGQLSLSGGTTLVLSPVTVLRDNGALGFYLSGSGPVVLSGTGGGLLPATENWTAFNPLSNGWQINAAYSTAAVRLISSPRNCIQFDALLNCTGATNADGTIVGNLPARFRPLQTKTFPVTCDQLRVIATGPPTTTESPRFSLDSAGNLKCFGIAAAATQVSLSGIIVPLDTN